MNEVVDRTYIEETIRIVKECLKNKRVDLTLTHRRLKNNIFTKHYNLGSKEQIIPILSHVNCNNFVSVTPNKNSNFKATEEIFVFIPKVRLRNIAGKLNSVHVYIKFKITNYCLVLVISLHEAQKNFKYYF